VAQKLKIPVEEVVDSAESSAELRQRQHLFVHQVFDELEMEEEGEEVPRKVLCVTHSAFIKGWLDGAFGIKLKGIINCSITRLRVSRDSNDGILRFEAPQDGDINDASHL
jgi:broad specificity phosphatase PhoE